MTQGFEKRRDVLYNDVEALIQYGYLTCNIDVNGCNMAMRSMFVGDSRLFAARAGLRPTDRSWKEWAVASSIWMLDGYDLTDQPNAAVTIRKSLVDMPDVAIDKLYHLFTQLYLRLTRAIECTEAFCYEAYSRNLWRMTNRGSIRVLNAVQHIWTAFNISEDERETWERDWIAARLVASAHNPKGVKKIAQQDDMNRKLEEDRRQHVIASLYKKITHQVLVEDENGNVFITARSKEELEEEMQRWVRGEKDWHDRVIDAYKESIRKHQESQREHHEQRMSHLQDVADTGLSGGTEAVGLTPEQLSDFLESKGRIGGKTTSTIVDLSSSYVYDKYLSQEIEVGGLSDGGKAVPVSSKPNLQEGIQRNVTWRDE